MYLSQLTEIKVGADSVSVEEIWYPAERFIHNNKGVELTTPFCNLKTYHAPLLHFLLRQRQREDKLRANPFRTDHIDVLIVGLNNLFHNGQSKSGTLLVLAS